MVCTSWRFVASLSDADQQMLTDAYHYAPKRSMRRRAHAVLLIHQGYAIDDIAEILWRRIKYNWLSLTAHKSFSSLCTEVHRILGEYGKKYLITFA